MKRMLLLFVSLLIVTLSLKSDLWAKPAVETAVYLPLIIKPAAAQPDPMVEFRGIWVSRFDWIPDAGVPADPVKIDEIVDTVAAAGFNVIFFQVRGVADALYASNLEPWSELVSGTYGQPPDPLWDPLALMVEKAHAKGIQVHAYINTLTVWNDCNTPPDETVLPLPLYHQLVIKHDVTNGVPNALQWDEHGNVYCNDYMRGTPASKFFQDHLIAVGTDLVTRYDVDGLHLDHIRYGGEITSCDPVSAAQYGAPCWQDNGYADWQRAQVNDLVQRFYEEVVPLKADLWLSAAVWPIHRVNPAWGFPGQPQEGYKHYYQDSKAWLSGGTIDSISPMIYPGGAFHCPDDSYWTVDRWATLVADYQAARNGRFIIPGIGAEYCTFDEIAQRIAKARDIGTAGHALFSYSGLTANGYFDDLANGPYAETAVVPDITWHP
ncbi:MAG: family 10 glycosylhydrolase [Anaerolineales bacterium]|nr:family 10 glycosylhydrolase [Anaerolineales bacterium]